MAQLNVSNLKFFTSTTYIMENGWNTRQEKDMMEGNWHINKFWAVGQAAESL
jgi:hypothetical protein